MKKITTSFFTFLALILFWSVTAQTQIGMDIDGEAAFDQSGYSVSTSADGKTVAIGAPINGGDAGHVRVYSFIGTSWVQLGSDIDAEGATDELGTSVSISDDGNTVAIGAPFNGGTGANAGHVRVYHFNGTSWVPLGNDIDGEAAGDLLGWSVSISADGNTVAIGAPFNGGDAGHVRVYHFNGTSWIQLGGDIDGEVIGDRSGNSVSISSDGNTVAIGAHLNAGTGTNAGHVRVCI